MALEEHKGRVIRLEIENFKSYRGKEVIGPFKHFTTIIGPNGSGKSNLMDAISFVLGVRTGVLRGSNLRELLYVNTDSKDPADHPTHGHVTLVFESPEGEEVLFTRAIRPASLEDNTYSSAYKLNGATVTADAYNQRLESYGILVRARNFLVFQGDIENVAQMSPKDLTTMFETISGSVALRREYDEAETRMKDAEASTAVVFSRRKAIAAEKRQKKEQKAEAEKHMGLVAELEASKVRHMLWQVYHLEQDMKQALMEGEALQGQVAQAEEAAVAAEADVNAQRRRQAGVSKDVVLLEKQMQKKRNEAEKKNPGVIKVRQQIAHAQRRLKNAEKEREAARNKAAEHTVKVASLEKQMEGLQDAQKQVQSEIGGSGKSARRMSLSPDLLEEYNEIKRQVGASTSKEGAELEALQAAADADAERLRMLQEAVESVDARIKDIEKSTAEDEARLARSAEAVSKAAEERAAKAEEHKTLQAERRRVEARRAQLERRIEESEGKLREAKADSKQSKREQAKTALVNDLKAAFLGRVYGTVTDLADPTAERYKLAMSVVLGRDFDSVIVDTSETAMQCIRVVKERRMPPMTFLPAETIRVKEVDGALRSLGGTSRLAIDTLHIKEERCTRAYQSICANTLLCDGVEEARVLAFNGEIRRKVVAVDGTAFMKTGIITGGLTSSMEQRASKWDAGVVGVLKEERERLAGELSGLPTLRELTEKLQAAEAAMTRLDSTLQYARADQKSTAQKLREAEAQLAALRREREAKAPGAAKLQASIADRQRRVEALQRKIDATAESLFAEFAAKIGVSSIREYEGKHLKEAEKLAEKRMAVTTQLARVRNQLEYESQADPAAEVARLEEEVADLGRQLEALRQEEAEHEAAAAEVKAELEALAVKVEGLKAKLKEEESASKELKRTARAAADQVAALRRSIAGAASKLEQLRAARGDVLESAAMEGIALPTRSSPTAAAKKVKAAAAAKRKKRRGAAIESSSEEEEEEEMDMESEEEEEVDEMEVDGEEAGPSAKKATKKVRFNFSSLTVDDKRREAKARERHESDMKAAMEQTAAQLARMAPNLKAVEQYEEVKGREREQIEEVEGCRRECKTASAAFNTIRQRRFDLFNAALSHITSSIDPIYKDLTRSALHPTGGQAYLAPENPEEPFSGGIKFSAMPPTKRFRDMEQLSGGEKTVAALALLFAVHSFHPSPFFVLDEIDAALDAANVAKVATYMRAKTRPNCEGGFQGIVISLKDVFYEKADALVGVCRTPAHGSSTTLTFDLNRYGPPMGAAS